MSAKRSVRKIHRSLPFLAAAFLLVGCSDTAQAGAGTAKKAQAPRPEHTETAIFAGGCFWCTEADFEKVEGVLEAVSGYIGGRVDNPTYRQVSNGSTGHTEAVEVEYDPAVVSYEDLVEIFWRTIDPTVEDRQFCDWGSQYRTGIFFRGEAQETAARASRRALETSKPFAEQIVTEITEASTFYRAEEYHQDYAEKNPGHYNRYRSGCGRDQRLRQLWGDSK